MSQSLLLLEVTCPNCRSVLTRGQHVPLGIHCVETGEDGEIRLSALFGDYAVETDLVDRARAPPPSSGARSASRA